jgi:hypothetical protein
MTIKKESEDQMAGLVVTKWDIREPDSRLFDPEHQSEDERDAKKDIEILESHVDLSAIYKPQSSSEQAKLLGKKDPFGPSGGGSSTRQYDRGGDDEDED